MFLRMKHAALASVLLVSCGGQRGKAIDPGDLAKERVSLEEGCEGGDGSSCTALGDMIMEGEKPDAEAARGWFEKGCELEEAEACLVVGNMAAEGGDEALACSMFEKSCQGGHGGGCFAQGWMLYEKLESEQDMVKARDLFERSCDLGYGTGCFHLATMWDRGQGGLEDPVFAMQLYQRACDLGEGQGCTVLHAKCRMMELEPGPSQCPGTY